MEILQRMPLSLRQIKYFVAAAEIGQVSQAATHLHISQSAVTTAIQELERILGTELFIRSPQGMALTESGRHFLNHAYSILGSVEDALNSPLPHNDIKGTLHVAASYTVMGYFLPYHIKRLTSTYPNLTIKLYEQEQKKIEEGLLDGSIDMAVLLTSYIASADIISETLLQSTRQLWLPAGHSLIHKNKVQFNDIVNEPYIVLNVDEAERVAERYWDSHNYKPNTILSTVSIEAVRSMVANGSGITILSDLVYRPWSLEGKRIETRSLEDYVPTLNLGVAWLKDMDVTPERRCFLDYFRQTYLTPHSVYHRSF